MSTDLQSLTIDMSGVVEECAKARFTQELLGFGYGSARTWEGTSFANRKAFRRDAIAYLRVALPSLAGILGVNIELFEVVWPDAEAAE